MTEEDMDEFRSFSKELAAILVAKKELDERIDTEGFTKPIVQAMGELTARNQRLIDRQKAFGSKHHLT